MQIIPTLVIMAAVFGLCFLVDRLFTKFFRGKSQHSTGLSVRLSKKYGSIGLILVALGVAAVFAGMNNASLVLAIGGGMVAVLGVGLVVYYLSFGVFYDEDSFILTTFGKKSTTYCYEQIQGQLLYNAYGNILIELHMDDGRTVGLQAGMVGVYPFLDKAFYAWCRQKEIAPEKCDFHDPDNSLWFPKMGES